MLLVSAGMAVRATCPKGSRLIISISCWSRSETTWLCSARKVFRAEAATSEKTASEPRTTITAATMTSTTVMPVLAAASLDHVPGFLRVAPSWTVIASSPPAGAVKDSVRLMKVGSAALGE